MGQGGGVAEIGAVAELPGVVSGSPVPRKGKGEGEGAVRRSLGLKGVSTRCVGICEEEVFEQVGEVVSVGIGIGLVIG